MLVNYNIQLPAWFIDKLTRSRIDQRQPKHNNALYHIAAAEYLAPGQQSIRDVPITRVNKGKGGSYQGDRECEREQDNGPFKIAYFHMLGMIRDAGFNDVIFITQPFSSVATDVVKCHDVSNWD